MKSYVARFERDENNYWSVVVQVAPKVSAISDGQTLQKARRRIRIAVAELLGVGEDEFALSEEMNLGFRVARAMDSFRSAKEQLEATQAKATKAQLSAVKALADLGISRADAGEMLGVSKQRIQQLLGGAS